RSRRFPLYFAINTRYSPTEICTRREEAHHGDTGGIRPGCPQAARAPAGPVRVALPRVPALPRRAGRREGLRGEPESAPAVSGDRALAGAPQGRQRAPAQGRGAAA